MPDFSFLIHVRKKKLQNVYKRSRSDDYNININFLFINI